MFIDSIVLHKDFFRRTKKKGMEHQLEICQGQVLLQRQQMSLKDAIIVLSLYMVFH